MEQKPLTTLLRASRLFRTASFLGCILSTIFLVGSAASQDITNHAVPIGGGAGSVGWKAAGPCNSSQALVWANVSSDPTCTTIQTPITPSALTKTDDTNVTLTLGGTPTTALLQATSLTLGWTGTLSVSRGGTGIGSGTSGGVPYFSVSGTIASSGALTANLPVIGGGAGVAPSVGTRSGNTTQFVTTTGAQTSGNCVSIDANGNHVASGAACAVTTNPTTQRLITGTAATYTAPANVIRQRVRLSGPGGGGGGASANNGSAGSGATSFQVNATGTAWTANAGGGGAAFGGAQGAGGSGGTDGSSGTLVIRLGGGTGGAGGSTITGSTVFPGGAGGTNMLGGGGGTAQQGQPTAPVANSGAGGGGGGGNSGTASGSAGGAGEYVEFWVTGMTSATYTIGTGGNGGNAGTNAGRAGAAGIVIVEEFYQ